MRVATEGGQGSDGGGLWAPPSGCVGVAPETVAHLLVLRLWRAKCLPSVRRCITKGQQALFLVPRAAWKARNERPRLGGPRGRLRGWAWHHQTSMLGLRSLARTAARPRSRYAKEQVADLLLTVEVGRLELWPASSRAACSRPHRAVGLRFLRISGDRWCPLRFPGRRPGCVPSVYRRLQSLRPRTSFGSPVLRDQGTDRPAGHGKADLCLGHGSCREREAWTEPPSQGGPRRRQLGVALLAVSGSPRYAGIPSTLRQGPSRTAAIRPFGAESGEDECLVVTAFAPS